MGKTLLTCEGLLLRYGPRTVLDIERFELREGDRVGLVGENGAGKTTLLKVLSGEARADAGAVKRLAEISFIRQMDAGAPAELDFDPRLRREFAAQEAREGLSGGERTRRRIASALSQPGHILLADEPTSDLDAQGIERLEKHLAAHQGALLLVSHDRALLDAVCTAIAELEDGHLTLFPGNYSAYRREKERRRDFQRFEYEQYRLEQARLRAAIQGKVESASQVLKAPRRMGNSEARLHRRSATEIEEKLHQQRKALSSRLEQLDEKERPREDPAVRIALGAQSPIAARQAAEVRGVTLRFGPRVLLRDAQMTLPTRSRTALIGPNGCGKSTLLERIVRGDRSVRLNPAARIGFFGQDHERALDGNKTALENAMALSVHPESAVRTVLANLLLRGDDVFKRAGVLSGGERAKVCLARLVVSDCNLLVLDEPTNHLDLYALEALQGVLAGYGGTLLLVSHDRAFVRAVATRLVFFRGQDLWTFEGTMDEWEERQKERADPAKEARLSRTVIEMRMAALAARLSRPQRGDDPEALNRQYQELVEQLRACRD